MKYRSTTKINLDKQLQCYVSLQEYKKVMAEYQVSGLYSISAFLRKKIIGNFLIIPDTGQLKSKLDLIGYQYERIGNNINQVARIVNLYHKKGRFPIPELARFNALMRQYLLVTGELSKAHRDFLRQLAKK